MTSLYPLALLAAVVFTLYYLAQLWIAAASKDNNSFMDAVRSYWWKLVLAIIVCVVLVYVGKQYGLFPQ